MNPTTSNPVADEAVSIAEVRDMSHSVATSEARSDTTLEADIAAWLRDEVLAQIAYQGTPDQLRTVLERHDRAAEQLTRIIELAGLGQA